MADSDEEIEEVMCDSEESKLDVVSDGEEWELGVSMGDKSSLLSLVLSMLIFSMLCLFGSSDVSMLFRFMSLSIMFSWTEWPSRRRIKVSQNLSITKISYFLGSQCGISSTRTELN